MAGLVPAIHAVPRFPSVARSQTPEETHNLQSVVTKAYNEMQFLPHNRVDGRDKPGHDGERASGNLPRLRKSGGSFEDIESGPEAGRAAGPGGSGQSLGLALPNPDGARRLNLRLALNGVYAA